MSKWLQSAPVAFLKGDVLVGVGDDDISNWPKERVLSRLGDRRVRVGDPVAILVSRPALLDAYWDARPSTRSAPSFALCHSFTTRISFLSLTTKPAQPTCVLP